MKAEISIRDYQPEDVQALANIYYNTIHQINIQHYTEEQVDVWAPKSSVENTEGWAKKFPRTKPINLSFGFLSSESAKIFDEIAPVSSKGIAEGTISEKKQGQDHEKIADSERIKPKTQVIIATLGDEIVGCAEFEPNGHIDCFYCHHEWIGKGVGSALMKEIFHIAKNNHIHHIFSEVSITAKPFFAKHGFKVVTEQTIVRKGVELTNFKMERTL